MKYFLLIFLAPVLSMADAKPIEFLPTKDGGVLVKMVVPHPGEAIIKRPNGETVWLQMKGEHIHSQIPDFENLGSWKINPSSVGTVYINGTPEVQPIIMGSGRYNLYIADNVETEPENTFFIECYFEIGE